MDDINSPTPTEAPTWRARLAALWTRLGNAYEAARAKVFAWWHTGNRSAVTAVLVILLLGAGALGVVLAFWPRANREPVAITAPADATLADLVLRVEALERVADQPPLAPSPDPVPARQGVPRAAVRPAQPPAPAAAQTRWGTTDFDREIADFTRSLNQPEQAK